MTTLAPAALAAAQHAYDVGGSMGLGLWRTRHKQAHGVDLSYSLLSRAVGGDTQDADEAPSVGYPLSGVAREQWDRSPRHLLDQARQIEAALVARRWNTALWAAGAMRDDAARTEWGKRIEEARNNAALLPR